MATTYCTTADITGRLQIPTATATSQPTSTLIDDIINKVEDYIDEETGHAWRSTTVSNKLYDYDGSGMLFLGNRTITTFVSGTDKIEVRDLTTTGTWTDLVLTANAYTAATTWGQLDADYYVDYDDGLIKFLNTQPMPGPAKIRMTYRYGESSVISNIEEATILLTCAKLVESERHVTVFQTPGGENLQPPRDQAGAWRKEAMRLIEKHKEPHEIRNTRYVSKRRYGWIR